LIFYRAANQLFHEVVRRGATGESMLERE
jgi:hypothetical protein